jgi:phosphatidylglycerol lysyltransferase
MPSTGSLDIEQARRSDGRPSQGGPVPVGRLRRHLLATLIELVPALALLLCSVSSDMVAMLGGDPVGLWRVLPAGPVAGDWVGAEVSSTAFLLVGIALLRRKRNGYWMALAMVAGSLVVQGATLNHPGSVITALGVGVVLLATRGRYHAGTGRRETVLAGTLLAGGVVLAAAAALAAATGADALSTMADAVGSLLDLATPVAVPGLATVGVLLVAARLAYVLASVLVLDPRHDDRSSGELAAAMATLRRVGRGALFPYQFAPECTAWADNAGTAALAVARVGRVEVALGDPAGEPAAAIWVLDAWLEHCRRDDLAPVVYQGSSELATRLRRRGWGSVLVGQEAILDPTSFDLSSPRVANLRHTVTRSRKGGITTVWSGDGLAALGDPRIVEAIVLLDQEWRRTAGPQMSFTVGRFDPLETAHTAIAVALDADGQPAAFAVLRPTGSDGGWMLDIMRRARGGVPGALEACLVTAIAALGEAGVTRLSLGLAPLAGLDPGSPSRSERWLARGARVVRPFYNHEGLAFFKDKFAPVWEPRFLLVSSWTSLSTAVIALLRLHLGVGWGRVVRSVAAGLIPAR